MEPGVGTGQICSGSSGTVIKGERNSRWNQKGGWEGQITQDHVDLDSDFAQSWTATGGFWTEQRPDLTWDLQMQMQNVWGLQWWQEG